MHVCERHVPVAALQYASTIVRVDVQHVVHQAHISRSIHDKLEPKGGECQHSVLTGKVHNQAGSALPRLGLPAAEPTSEQLEGSQPCSWPSSPWSPPEKAAQAVRQTPPSPLHCCEPAKRNTEYCGEQGLFPTCKVRYARRRRQTKAGKACWCHLLSACCKHCGGQH